MRVSDQSGLQKKEKIDLQTCSSSGSQDRVEACLHQHIGTDTLTVFLKSEGQMLSVEACKRFIDMRERINARKLFLISFLSSRIFNNSYYQLSTAQRHEERFAILRSSGLNLGTCGTDGWRI